MTTSDQRFWRDVAAWRASGSGHMPDALVRQAMERGRDERARVCRLVFRSLFARRRSGARMPHAASSASAGMTSPAR